MKVLILAHNPDTYSNLRLMETFASRGHLVQTASPTDCLIKLGHDGPTVNHQGASLGGIDLALLRCSGFSWFSTEVVRIFETLLGRHFQAEGVPCVNKPDAKLLSHNKLYSLQALNKAGLPIPTSILTWRSGDIEQVVTGCLGAPLILKMAEGTEGIGTMRADSVATACSVFDAFRAKGYPVLAQEYINSREHGDLRIIVLGEQVVGAVRRFPRDSDFRSGTHYRYKVERENLDEHCVEIAVEATKSMGLEISGVDLIESNTGPVILEVNASPSLATEKVMKVDLAAGVVSYLENKYG